MQRIMSMIIIHRYWCNMSLYDDYLNSNSTSTKQLIGNNLRFRKSEMVPYKTLDVYNEKQSLQIGPTQASTKLIKKVLGFCVING